MKNYNEDYNWVEIINKWEHCEAVTIDEIIELGTTNVSDLANVFYEIIRTTFERYCRRYAEPWKYDDGEYEYAGYKFQDGRVAITIATTGSDPFPWCNDNFVSLCMPLKVRIDHE